ncbi:Glucosyltransferase-like protein [Aspergillus hancockii]|nr:Glucosyltransferase-like protein [Aspergillus hancockii]
MAPPPSYRPRKKRKFPLSSSGSNNALIADDGNGKASPAFPLVSFLWAARAGVSQWLILPLILLAVGLFRWAVSLWGYSGFQVPPMHGDFEAQRHWMEITIHLPMSKWYTYDLQYWGLDYPPLTAYHSWLLGKIGTLFDSSWFALDASRGFEEPRLKVFMRATVVVSEYLVYIPAVVNFLRRYTQMHGVPVWSASIALAAILLQPSTILIDHGHFQYNTVMLGLVAASLDAILAGRMLWACIFFVGALGFKQMALYYAPVMFAFLLGICVFPRIQIIRLLCISLVTIIAFAVLLVPLVVSAVGVDARNDLSSVSLPPLLQALPIELDKSSILYAPLLQLAQVIHRMFPFARGLFEDKRDGLRVPYFVMTFLWAYLLGLPPTSFEVYRSRTSPEDSNPLPEPHMFTKLIHSCFYLAMVAWHVVEAFIPPPSDKPDLWVVLNVLIGAGGFGLAYLWCLRKLIVQCWKINRCVEKDTQKKNQ